MSVITQCIRSVKIIDGIIKRQTADLTHEDTLLQLPFPGNCMNWNLGHILVYRAQYLGVLDGVSKPDPAEFAVYGGGSPALTDGSTAMPLETLLQRLDDASAQVIAALEAFPAERLAEIYDEARGQTIEDRLAFYIIFH
ncbi:MAG: DinB family protein, partial [Caldilineaceae bacterium]|nr:DinB family protein [Caldilineaceae bacterium]